MSDESKYANGQRLVISGGNELDRQTLPEHWLLHPFTDGEVVEVLDLDHNTDEYDHAVYLVEAGDGVYAYVSEANLTLARHPVPCPVTTTTPPGLTVSEDGSVLNWQGVNYVPQRAETTAATTEDTPTAERARAEGVESLAVEAIDAACGQKNKKVTPWRATRALADAGLLALPPGEQTRPTETEWGYRDWAGVVHCHGEQNARDNAVAVPGGRTLVRREVTAWIEADQ